MQSIGVVGSGTMGAGIAQVSALAGYDVVLYDIHDDALEKARSRIESSLKEGVIRGKLDAGADEKAAAAIQTTTALEHASKADLVIEAAPEDLALKRKIFRHLDESAPERTILASNTSSLSINALAGAVARSDRFLGLHFFNPPHLMKLVEVIRGDDTSPETMAAANDFVRRLGKEPVYCQDTPAFIVNRVARPFYGEAFRLLGEGAATVQDIDALLRSAGFRMGPFQLVDLIGCDVNFTVTESVYAAYFQDPKYRPHPIQRLMVESGRLGRKSGRGFYRYEE